MHFVADLLMLAFYVFFVGVSVVAFLTLWAAGSE